MAEGLAAAVADPTKSLPHNFRVSKVTDESVDYSRVADPQHGCRPCPDGLVIATILLFQLLRIA
jgi:hypothetical protein